MKINIAVVVATLILAVLTFFSELRVFAFWSGILLVLPCAFIVGSYLLAQGSFATRLSLATIPWAVTAVAAYIIILQMAPPTDQIGSLDKLFFEVTVMSSIGGLITIGVFKVISETVMKKKNSQQEQLA